MVFRPLDFLSGFDELLLKIHEGLLERLVLLLCRQDGLLHLRHALAHCLGLCDLLAEGGVLLVGGVQH